MRTDTIVPMEIVVCIVAVVVSAVGGYYFTAGILRLAQRRSVKEDRKTTPILSEPAAQPLQDVAPENDGHHGGQQTTHHSGGPEDAAAKNALRGGMWIGILERMLITAFLIAAQPAGVAVVIAIKGLGRYPELNSATSERFIIGTLASLAWAALCALVAVTVINRVL